MREGMPMLRARGAALAGLAALLGAAAAQAQGAAADLADAVRDRGHACAQVVSAERDEAASRPDEAVWILTCSDGRYRIRFAGDTGPQVERLD
jgi:hypothetical protein